MLAVAIGTEKLSHKCMHQLILCVCVTPQHNKIKQNDTRNEVGFVAHWIRCLTCKPNDIVAGGMASKTTRTKHR